MTHPRIFGKRFYVYNVMPGQSYLLLNTNRSNTFCHWLPTPRAPNRFTPPYTFQSKSALQTKTKTLLPQAIFSKYSVFYICGHYEVVLCKNFIFHRTKKLSIFYFQQMCSFWRENCFIKKICKKKMKNFGIVLKDTNQWIFQSNLVLEKQFLPELEFLTQKQQFSLVIFQKLRVH